VLQADWDPTFSEHSFGFRPGRSAHQAVARAQAFIASGHGIVVDLDLEKFFDRVNHDILMGLVAKRVTDKRILELIRGFLTAGVLIDGLVGPMEEGTPQGGLYCGPVLRHPAELLPAVDLGGRVWLGGRSCKGWPAGPRLRRLAALTGPATQPSFATKNSTARSG
jgi:reverse transcriptase-like protein